MNLIRINKNKMEIFTRQQNSITGKWGVVRTSDEDDMVYLLGNKEFDTEPEVIEYQNQQIGLINNYDSIKLIGNFESRLNQLSDKNFDRRSFYNGWKEGRAELLKELKQ